MSAKTVTMLDDVKVELHGVLRQAEKQTTPSVIDIAQGKISALVAKLSALAADPLLLNELNHILQVVEKEIEQRRAYAKEQNEKVADVVDQVIQKQEVALQASLEKLNKDTVLLEKGKKVPLWKPIRDVLIVAAELCISSDDKTVRRQGHQQRARVWLVDALTEKYGEELGLEIIEKAKNPGGDDQEKALEDGFLSAEVQDLYKASVDKANQEKSEQYFAAYIDRDDTTNGAFLEEHRSFIQGMRKEFRAEIQETLDRLFNTIEEDSLFSSLFDEEQAYAQEGPWVSKVVAARTVTFNGRSGSLFDF